MSLGNGFKKWWMAFYEIELNLFSQLIFIFFVTELTPEFL